MGTERTSLQMAIYIVASTSLVSKIHFDLEIGKPCGYGQYTWKNGSTYMGEFYDGLKNGFGKWRKEKSARSNMYEGQYFRDKKQGFGIFKWASGNIYRGQYKVDEREGLGEMRWTDGSIYTGYWEHGIQNGYGRMCFPDGTVKEGLFENNIYRGPTRPEEIPKEFLEGAIDIMELLAPRELSFSEEVTTYSPPIRHNKTAQSGLAPRFSPPQRFMTASENPQQSNKGVRQSTIYAMPMKQRGRSKDSTIVVQRNNSGEKYGKMRETQSTLNGNNSSFTGSSRSLLPFQQKQGLIQVRPKGIFYGKKRGDVNMATMYGENERASMPAQRQRRRECLPSQDPGKRVWRPSGKVHYTESNCTRPRIVMYH